MNTTDKQTDLIGDAYENYINKEHLSMSFNFLTQEEFIIKIKTDDEFSQRWGISIETRELSLFEKTTLYCIKMGYHSWKERVLGTIEINGEEYLEKEFTKYNIPTKLTTINYNGQIQEKYE